MRGNDLHRFGKSGHARRQIDGVAKDIPIFFDHGAKMPPHPNRTLDARQRRQGHDLELHVHSGQTATISIRQNTHHLVTNGLDHAPTVLSHNAAHRGDAFIDHFLGLDITEHFINPGAARKICKQDRHRCRWLVRHFFRLQIEIRGRYHLNCLRAAGHEPSYLLPSTIKSSARR